MHSRPALGRIEPPPDRSAAEQDCSCGLRTGCSATIRTLRGGPVGDWGDVGWPRWSLEDGAGNAAGAVEMGCSTGSERWLFLAGWCRRTPGNGLRQLDGLRGGSRVARGDEMAQQKRGLGKGLGALIPAAPASVGQGSSGPGNRDLSALAPAALAQEVAAPGERLLPRSGHRGDHSEPAPASAEL